MGGHIPALINRPVLACTKKYYRRSPCRAVFGVTRQLCPPLCGFSLWQVSRKHLLWLNKTVHAYRARSLLCNSSTATDSRSCCTGEVGVTEGSTVHCFVDSNKMSFTFPFARETPLNKFWSIWGFLSGSDRDWGGFFLYSLWSYSISSLKWWSSWLHTSGRHRYKQKDVARA